MIIIPEIFRDSPKIKAFHTTRKGGKSEGNFRSMNLGISSGDSAEQVQVNREIVLREQNLHPHQVITTKQVHSDKIIRVKGSGGNHEADGMITDAENLFLAVSSADCASILIAEKSGKALAAVHSGWRGTHLNIASQTVQKFYEYFNIKPSELLVYVGPCIGPNAFEVDEDVYLKFPSNYFYRKEKKWLLDLKKVISDQLKTAGVPENQTEISTHCTHTEEENFFSFRRDKGITGRHWAVIGKSS